MALKENFTVVLSLAVFFSTCTGVTVTIDNLDDVIEGSETRMICNYNPTSGGTIIITWSNVTGGASATIATTVVGISKDVQPAYSAIFTLDPNDDRALVINNTLRSYSGDYECDVLITGVSSGKNDVTLNVIYIEEPVLSFTTPVKEGDQVTLSCDVVSEPNAQFTFKNNVSILQQGGLSTYTFTADRDNQGSYTCETSNSAGSKATAGQVLDVYYIDIEIEIDDGVIPPGETVTIPSTVTANPPDVTYLWTTDLPGNEDAINNGFEYKLNISKLKDEDSFVVNVTATNSAGSKTDSAKITISETPSTTPTPEPNTTDPPDPPEPSPTPGSSSSSLVLIIVGSGGSVIIIVVGGVGGKKIVDKKKKRSRITILVAKAEISTDGGLNIKFKLAKGETLQHFDWYRCDQNGEKGAFLVRSGDVNSRFTVVNGSLNIRNVKDDDDGHYICEMKTSKKVVTVKAKFTVTKDKCGRSSINNDVETGTEAKEGAAKPLVRYEAKSGELYTEVNLKDKKKKQVEPEKDPSELYAKVDMDKKTKKPERPAQVDKQSRNAEGLTYAELDLTRNLPKDTINHPDAETTYASIQQQPSRI